MLWKDTLGKMTHNNRIPTGEYWAPAPGPQEEALCRSENEILCGGARGGGKTDIGLAWIGDPDYISHPEYRSLVVRKDYDDLTDWIFRAKIFFQGMGEVIGNPAYIRWNAGGITRLGHWKDKKTIGKYIGHEYWKMLIEELTQSISSYKEYKMLLGSLRISESVTKKNPAIIPQFMGNTNPGGAGHAWVHRYWVETCENKTYIDPDTEYSRIFIPFKATDNPYISPQYIKWLNGLPEPLRSAWRDGKWDCFEGQFFTDFGTHLAEEPFQIPRVLSMSSLYGSLDIGINHPTSYGHHLKDNSARVHRLFTYKNRGMTHREHAKAIYDRILEFQETGGCFPQIVWVGHDAFEKSKNNAWSTTSPVEEYRDVFKDTCTKFLCANTNRTHGCGIMHRYFSYENGMSNFVYWKRYNESFVESITTVLIDPDKPEEYQKQDGDDPTDECRYGLVGIASQGAIDLQAKEQEAVLLNQDPGGDYEYCFRDSGMV